MSATNPPNPSTAAPAGAPILVVDDEPTMLEVFAQALSPKFEVTTANAAPIG